jgi:hypothetical protein
MLSCWPSVEVGEVSSGSGENGNLANKPHGFLPSNRGFAADRTPRNSNRPLVSENPHGHFEHTTESAS